MICISTGNLQQQAGYLNRIKPDLVEVRIDLAGEEVIEHLSLLDRGIRRIATCRQGGRVKDVVKVLGRALETGVDYVDIDLAMDSHGQFELKKEAEVHGVDVIISWHNFELTPAEDELKQILHRCYDKGADVAKIATMTRNVEDAALLLSLYAEKGRKVILGMGAAGRITRFAAVYLGAEFTFAAVNEQGRTASGQPVYQDFLEFTKLMDN